MHKLSQKVVASGLSLALVVGLTPLPAYAADSSLQAGSTQLSTQVATKWIDDTSVSFITSVHTYDGAAFKPAPTVSYYGKVLTENVDYQLTYDTENPVEPGTYYVSLTGLGEYQGTYENAASYRIVKTESNWDSVDFNFVGAKSTFAFTGGAIKPEVVGTLDGVKLTPGTDYSVKYGQYIWTAGETRYYDEDDDEWYTSGGSYVFTEMEPTEAGKSYIAQISPEGAYKTDTAQPEELYYTIANAKSLDNADIVWPGTQGRQLAYTGGVVNLNPIVLIDGKELTLGTDYTVTAQQYDPDAVIVENGTTYTGGYVDVTPVEVGEYRLKITGIGNYASTTNEPNTTTTWFTIYSGKSLNDSYADVYFASGNSFAYTGASIQPKPVVTYRGQTLTEGVDYVLTYESTSYYYSDGLYYTNGDQTVRVGSYRAVVHGIGNYRGETSVYYEIYNPNDFSSAEITLPNGTPDEVTYYPYTGKAQLVKPAKVEVYGKATTNYTVAYTMEGAWIDSPKEPGYYTMYLIGTGEFAGQVATTHFRIVEANSLLAATVSMTDQFKWDNKAHKPKPTVVLGGKVLKQGKDYTISYYGNVNGTYNGYKKIASPKAAGSYYVLITPKGSKYVDSFEQHFTIKAANLADADETTVTLKKDVLPYTGKNLKPTVVVKTANGKKVASSNYTVATPIAAKAMGTYTVTITGKKNLRGSKTLTFTVGPKNAKISKLKAASKGFTAKWKKITKNNKGYQVRYSVNKDMSKAKTKTVKKAKKTSLKVTKLKSGTKYYVQIRTMTKANGQTLYGNWSAAKTVTTK